MPYRGNNYSFVIDSSFTPFTMQEMLIPFTAYKDVYDKMEEDYVEMSDKANKFEYLSKTLPEGSKAREIYENYANELKTQATDFAQNGVNMSNRRALNSLRRRYQGEIGMLSDLVDTRKAQIKQQQDLRIKDPTAIFSRRADMTSLDDYLTNPDLSYEYYSGAMLTKQVADAASHIAKSLHSYGNGQPLDEFTKTWIQNHGYTPAQVAQAINNPNAEGSSSILNTLVNSVVQSSPIPKWGDPAMLNEAYSWARQGLWSAVGQSTVNTYDDYRAKKTYEQSLEDAQNPSNNGVAINPMNIYTQKELEDIDDIENFKKYFKRDSTGAMHLTAEGVKEYNRKVMTVDGKPTTTPEGTTILTEAKPVYHDSPFKQFMDRIGAGRYAAKGAVGRAGNIWAQHIKSNPNVYDATKVTEFDYRLDDPKVAKSVILDALSGNDLNEVRYDKDKKSFVPTGNTMSIKDLNDDKTTILSTRISPYGNSVRIKDSSGKVKRYELPPGINHRNEANVSDALSRAAQLQQFILQKGVKDRQGKFQPANPEQIAQAQELYSQLLQQAYMYHSQLFLNNKTKDQEFYKYGY